MRGASRITCLWPGLPQLWHQGDLWALGLSAIFALLLNSVVLARFVSTEGSWHSFWGYGWLGVVVFWAWGVWWTARRSVSGDESVRSAAQQDLFIRAQTEYLRGHWSEAQSLLEQLVRRQPGDVESRLLLSSVFRRSHRIDLARKQLRQLDSFDGAVRWRFEIERELGQLDRTPETGA